MNNRFILILLLLAASFVAWTYIHYQYQESKQLRLDQLAQLPVYVYLEDEALADSLGGELRQLGQIQKVEFSSGIDAAKEIVKSYGLDVTESTLRNYDFPHVLTLLFKPELLSFPARDKALRMISARGVSSVDIDTQEAAWKLCKQELTQLRGRWTISTLIIAVALFLLAFFMRFYLYLEEKLLNLGTKQDLLTAMHARKRRFRQSLLLFLIPALLSPLLYYFLVAVGTVKPLVDWQFFCIQAGTVLAGILASHLLIKGREQLSIWDFEPPAAGSSL
ncbi:MAG: hypothetical protein BWX75_01032 [Candidatus Cloacimonetes bacterium ADurb.Bin088]|jgi:hypothetical protein|nr:MAG: hypothetical protein BWX75_01032 [Candidatus Cloacimonetes bacterium ADurb.Bin088]